MKIGVIGAGAWGKNLVRNFHEMGVLAGVADGLKDNREWAQQTAPEIAIFEDSKELIEAGYDAVAIATPAPSHFDVAKAAMEAGLDVFVEKPMTLGSKEANELVEIADKHNRILMVGHLLMFQQPIQAIKKFLAEQRLGKIYHLHQERKKLGRARYVENVTWSLGVHDIAVLLYLVGEQPRHVYASGHCGLQEKVEDDVYVHMEFVGGVKAHLHNSWLWPENRRQLTIVGEKGMVVYNEITGVVSFHKKTINSALDSNDEGSEILFEGGEPPLRLELQHFLDCVKTRSTPIADGRNGAAVVSVLERMMMF